MKYQRRRKRKLKEIMAVCLCLLLVLAMDITGYAAEENSSIMSVD